MENLDIPKQYSVGFNRREIPLNERPYGEYIGKTLRIEGGLAGTFEGSHQSPDGVVCHFSRWIIHDNGMSRIEEGHAKITITGNPQIIISDKRLEEYSRSSNNLQSSFQPESRIIIP